VNVGGVYKKITIFDHKRPICRYVSETIEDIQTITIED